MTKKITVYLKPNSKHEKIENIDGGYKIMVKEPPVDNLANQSLIRVISKYLDIPKSKVKIIIGLKSRRKIIEIID